MHHLNFTWLVHNDLFIYRNCYLYIQYCYPYCLTLYIYENILLIKKHLKVLIHNLVCIPFVVIASFVFEHTFKPPIDAKNQIIFTSLKNNDLSNCSSHTRWDAIYPSIWILVLPSTRFIRIIQIYLRNQVCRNRSFASSLKRKIQNQNFSSYNIMI